MPIGYLIGLLIHGSLVALSLAAPRRPRALSGLSYRVATVYNELPSFFIVLMLAFSIEPFLDGTFTRPSGLPALVLLLIVIGTFVAVGWCGAKARPVVQRAL